MALEEPEVKRFKHATISDRVYSADFQDGFSRSWHANVPVETAEMSLITEPFRLCRISNFIKSETFMDELKNELSDVKSRRQSIDLYQFEQTSDLANVESANLRRLYEAFQTDVCSWMSSNTKIELNNKISMSSSCYYDTDYLLCHDDNLGDRRIAFILYLSKNWTAEDGGTLDLFDTDDNGLPRKIVRSLVPEYNSLVFFEVVDNSYHQVAEVTSPEKSRWTINGWFHGPPRHSSRPPRPEIEQKFVRPADVPVKLDSWITDSYLRPEIVKEIQKDVELKSYTFLANFLKPEVYERLSEDLTSGEISWALLGPADVRRYEVADPESLTGRLREFYELFRSLCVFRLLKDYTELDLVPEEGLDPKMTVELQRWSRGCYTLICDRPTAYRENSTRDEEFDDKPPTSNGSTSSRSRNRHEKRSTRRLSASSNEDMSEDEILRRILNGKSPRSTKKSSTSNGRTPQQQASCSKLDDLSTGSGSKRGAPVNPDSEDSDVSDIGDYLSDPFDCSLECSEDEAGNSSVAEPGTLDVIVQFHTSTTNDDDTIDYVDPREQEGALIHVPSKDNHLCLVYKTVGTSRLHKYVNHYCKGYFYNLVCTYHE